MPIPPRPPPAPPGSPQESTVAAPIVSVTVYPDRARVTRRVASTLSTGRHRLLVGPLPLRLQTDSVRVGGRGPATVLGVDVARRTGPDAPDTATAAVQQRRRDLVAELAELADDEEVLRHRAAFLTTLGERAGGTYARALAAGDTDAAAVTALADALSGQLTAGYARRRELAARRERLTEAVAAVDRQLAAAGGPGRPDQLAVTIDVEVADASAEVVLELSYVVDGAGWESSYDLRVDGERLILTWYGLVTQRTGEDWPECALSLSTARASAAAAVADLEPWYLDRWRPAPPPRMPYDAMAYGSPAPPGAAPMAAGAGPAAAAESPWGVAEPVRQSTASIEQGATAATYRSARPIAVPADGAAHRATVAVLELAAALDYVTAPVTAPEAHLRATVVNRTEHTLLPGRASVYTGGDFVGVATLDTWAPGEEVELALGVDDRVRVERRLVGRRAAKATLGSTRRRDVEYRTTVTNHTPRPARITVLDQLPVSRDEHIQVRELHLHPPPADRTELGVLTWRFALAPGESAEVLTGVRVELGRGVEMTGWRE